jgi:hypothetical protein
MTARLRRWTRRCESDHVSNVLAAFWRHRHADLGTFAAYLLGETRVRKVVAVALLLEIESTSVILTPRGLLTLPFRLVEIQRACF